MNPGGIPEDVLLVVVVVPEVVEVVVALAETDGAIELGQPDCRFLSFFDGADAYF